MTVRLPKPTVHPHCAAVTAVCMALTAAGCATRGPVPPQVVRVPVEVVRPLPAWATEPLPLDEPRDATVGELLRSWQRRGETIRYAECRSRLIEQVQAGREADPSACKRSD